MKYFTLLIILVGITLGQATPISAQVTKPETVATQAQSGSIIVVKVNGLVCSFCAQGIKKSFLKLPAVKNVQVSLEKKKVTLELKDKATLSDNEIQSTIKAAGYVVVEIQR